MGAVVGINRGGRPRLPTALKKLKGTSTPSRENPSEPTVVPTRIGKPPDDLTETEAARWRELARAVNRLGVACAGDLAGFRSMVEALAYARECYQGVKQEDGTFARDLTEWAKADARWEKWASHFGLTPATRPKVNRISTEKKKRDPLDEFAG